ncbi:MAG: hypothetical protein HRT87_00145 [Legionellales bacterium]|nr:hypothetical protein [Legionellales bacterium]
MISILLNRLEDCTAKNTLEYIDKFSLTVSNKKLIEIVALVDKSEQKYMLEEIEKKNYSFSVLFYTQHGQSDSTELNNIFTNSFLNTNLHAEIIIPINSNTKFTKGWDVALVDTIKSASLKHKYFVIRDSNTDGIIFSKQWLDCLSGFGLYKNYIQYHTLICKLLQDENNITSLLYLKSNNIFKEHIELVNKNHFEASHFLQNLISYQKKSIVNSIIYDSEKEKQKSIIRQHNLVNCAHRLANSKLARRFLNMCLVEHSATTSRYIFRHHTAPIIDVIIFNSMFKRGLINKDQLSSWAAGPKNWGIDICEEE